MDTSSFFQIYGWFAYVSATATILTFVTSILFFAIGKPFGKINDISSVFQMFFMIPLAIMFYQLLSKSTYTLALLSALLGISGILISAYGQSMLVLGRIDFEGSRKYFPAGAGIGIWLILICVLAFVYGQIPQFLAWIGILAGTGYIATVIGFLWSGQQNMLFAIGALGLGITYPIWAIWTGRLLMLGTFR